MSLEEQIEQIEEASNYAQKAHEEVMRTTEILYKLLVKLKERGEKEKTDSGKP